ncbi:hypothetical protein [Yoonia sp. 208BN28-4]|uniref:hypothetical protein n=1 Tax=Yoonia sp. 208BN28-4 TaxID=3126505 RepID=UPI0030A313F6
MCNVSRPIGRLGVTAAALLLGACSTTNTGSGPNNNVYRTLLNTDAATSEVVAVMRRFETGGSVDPDLRVVADGSITHDTQAFTLTLPANQPLITDSDGPDNNNQLVDDTTPAITGTNVIQEVDNGYGYVQPLLINDPTGTNNIRYYGFAGIPLQTEDFPSSGTAIFNGTIGGNAPFEDWEKEPATLTATFDGANSTVALAAQNTTSGGVVVDLSITGAQFTGDTFGGGTAVATADGVPIDISSQVAPDFTGRLFGLNEDTGMPGDVGALFGAKGAVSTFDLIMLGTTITP